MQRLRAQLAVWEGTITRGVGATSFTITPAEESGAFSMRAEWKSANGTCSHEKLFSPELVFGRTYGGSPLALAVQKRACDYARDFMREVLNQRGLAV